MAVTVTSNLTTLDACDSSTGWTVSGGKLTLETDDHLEGSGCLSDDVDIETPRYSFALGGTSNWSGANAVHIWVWMLSLTAQYLDVQSNGGMRIEVEDTGGAYASWYVGGSDTYAGGWRCFVAYTDTTTAGLDLGVDMTSITRVGLSFKGIQKSKLATNCYWDYIRYGPGITITGGTTGDRGTFEEILTADQTADIGAIRKENSVYFIQGNYTFGDTGTATTYFEDSSQVIVWENAQVSSTFHSIDVVGNSTGTNHFQLGDVTGSGSSAIGTSAVTLATAGPDWSLSCANTNVDTFALYNSNFNDAGIVSLGSTTTKLGGSSSTIHLIDNTFARPQHLTRNLESTATGLNQLRNKITFATNTTYSLDIYDAIATSLDEWQIIGSTATSGSGFQASSAGTQTLTVTNHNFNQIDTPYLTIAADETWDVINPSWTINTAGQTELDFTSTTSNQVNEKFSLDLTIQTPSGYKIGEAQTYIYEGLTNQNLPTANRQDTDQVTSSAATVDFNENSPSADTITRSTGSFITDGFTSGMTLMVSGSTSNDGFYTIDTVAALTITLVNSNDVIAESSSTGTVTGSNGTASSNITTREFTAAAVTGALTVASFGDFSLKVYYYGRTPFTGALTVNAAINQSVTLVTDSAIATASQATAISNGSGITLAHSDDATLYPHILLTYDGGTVAFTPGETVTGDTSGATGTVVEVTEGDTASGRIFIGSRTTSTLFQDNEPLNGSTGGNGMANVDLSGGDGGQLQFAWHIDCNSSKTLQVCYDYLASQMAADTPSATFYDAIEWGEDEQSQLLYSGASGYFTERNINLTEGVFISKYTGGTVAYFTADDNTTYTPATSVTLTINGVVQNTQCYIETVSGSTQLLNSSATTNVSGDEYSASASYTYTSDTDVLIRAREMGYLPYQASGTISSGGLTVTAIWQVDPNWKLEVSGESITFNDANPDTIVRATGNFATDGWLGVMSQVTIEGSQNNDGTYEIASVSGATVTLEASETLTAGTDSSGVTLTYTRRTPTW